jgi:hypothetical protein
MPSLPDTLKTEMATRQVLFIEQLGVKQMAGSVSGVMFLKYSS